MSEELEKIKYLEAKIKDMEYAIMLSDNVLRLTHSIFRNDVLMESNFDRQLKRAREANSDFLEENK